MKVRIVLCCLCSMVLMAIAQPSFAKKSKVEEPQNTNEKVETKMTKSQARKTCKTEGVSGSKLKSCIKDKLNQNDLSSDL